MVGMIQTLAVRCATSMMRVDEQLTVVEKNLRGKGTQYAKKLQREDAGAVTAEYAVVLIAATGFATLLVLLLKSDEVRNTLSELVKKALKVG